MDQGMTFERAIGWAVRHRGLALSAAAALLVLVLLVPLPSPVLDLLLVGNLALSAVILLTAIHVRSPLEFSVFPSVLLGATLLRLVLNVASTRLILTSGAGGLAIDEAQYAAGRVVYAFSEFVTVGSWQVGVILFAIIVIVQFVVVTKGSTRISEVAARFVLDAMPGRQMAIDADLSSGAITQEQAQRRRVEVSREADFYGAMDGASRFLRGDAIAGILIILVNILGGLYVGLVQYGWSWAETLSLFTRLTVGDGLVTQVPAFLVAVAAALTVSRGPTRCDLGETLVGQLTARPAVLGITAAFLGLLTLTSLPKLPLLMLGVGCGGLAWLLVWRRGNEGSGDGMAAEAETAGEGLRWAPAAVARTGGRPAGAGEQDLEDLLTVDAMRLEVGYALVRLVEPSLGGAILERIAELRRRVAGELGVLIPPIRIRDNLRMEAHGYVIYIRGARAAAGRIYPGQLLAVAGDQAEGTLVGRETTEPAFGSPAVWIAPAQRAQAEGMDYAVIEPADVLMGHLAQTVRRRCGELLSRRQVTDLLDRLRQRVPGLVDELTQRMSVGQVQRVLQALLREAVPIRDLETILEALGEFEDVHDLDAMVEHVRLALARTLCQSWCGDDGKLWCVTADPRLEDAVASCLTRTSRGTTVTAGPDLARRVIDGVEAALGQLRRRGCRGVILCTPAVRSALRQILAAGQPDVAVLAYSEIESVEVEAVASASLGERRLAGAVSCEERE